MGILATLFIARASDLKGADFNDGPEEALPDRPCASLNGITHLALAELESQVLKTPFTKLIKPRGQHPVGGYAWTADPENGPWLVALSDRLASRLAEATLEDLSGYAAQWFDSSEELLIHLAGLCRQVDNANGDVAKGAKDKMWRVYLWYSL